MEAIEVNEKIMKSIMKFEELLKLKVEDNVKSKHQISLNDPQLAQYYSGIKEYHTKGIDLSALIIIIRKDLLDYCPPTSISYLTLVALKTKNELGVLLGIRNKIAHGNSLDEHTPLQ